MGCGNSNSNSASSPSETKNDSEKAPESKPAEQAKPADNNKEELEKIDKPAQFENQGGHEGAFQKLDEKKIMKKGGKSETAFYEQIHSYSALQSFAPSFYGIQENHGEKYIIIEDLTWSFKKPCVLDVKIGQQSFGEDASPEKREAMAKKDKNSTTHPLGARITAMKVYQPEINDYKKSGKAEGQKVTVDNFQDALSEYFHNGKHMRKSLISKFIEKIEKIREWAEQQGDVRIYSSSLLFIYDGEESDSDEHVELKMIDFAHVHKIEDGGKDDGYIFGVQNLLKSLNGILSS